MNTFTKIAMSCAGLFLVTTSAFAEISQKKAKELLKLAHDYTVIEKTPKTIIDDIVISAHVKKKEITDKQKAKMIVRSKSLLDPKELLDQVEKDVAQSLDEEDYIALLAWYSSDLGQKKGLKNPHNVDINKEKKVSNERRVILNEIYKVLKTEEKQRKAMNTNINIYMDFVEKKAKKEGKHHEPSIMSYTKSVMINSIDEHIAKTKDNLMAYMCQEYSDEELTKQLEFFKSPAYQRFKSSSASLDQKIRDHRYKVLLYSNLLSLGIEE